MESKGESGEKVVECGGENVVVAEDEGDVEKEVNKRPTLDSLVACCVCGGGWDVSRPTPLSVTAADSV